MQKAIFSVRRLSAAMFTLVAACLGGMTTAGAQEQSASAPAVTANAKKPRPVIDPCTLLRNEALRVGRCDGARTRSTWLQIEQVDRLGASLQPEIAQIAAPASTDLSIPQVELLSTADQPNTSQNYTNVVTVTAARPYVEPLPLLDERTVAELTAAAPSLNDAPDYLSRRVAGIGTTLFFSWLNDKWQDRAHVALYNASYGSISDAFSDGMSRGDPFASRGRDLERDRMSTAFGLR